MALVGPDWRVVYLDGLSCLLLEGVYLDGLSCLLLVGRIFRWTQLPPNGGTYI